MVLLLLAGGCYNRKLKFVKFSNLIQHSANSSSEPSPYESCSSSSTTALKSCTFTAITGKQLSSANSLPHITHVSSVARTNEIANSDKLFATT